MITNDNHLVDHNHLFTDQDICNYEMPQNFECTGNSILGSIMPKLDRDVLTARCSVYANIYHYVTV